MPEIGEIKRCNHGILIWHSCEICGGKRWVQLLNGEPRRRLCAICSRLNNTRALKDGSHAGLNRRALVKTLLHPNANGNGYVVRSRFNLEQALGRPLKRGCHVHHINGNTHDDRPENLMELTPREHMKLHRQLEKERRAGLVGASPAEESEKINYFKSTTQIPHNQVLRGRL